MHATVLIGRLSLTPEKGDFDPIQRNKKGVFPPSCYKRGENEPLLLNFPPFFLLKIASFPSLRLTKKHGMDIVI